MVTQPTDAELIQQVLRGNQQPFGVLVERYQNLAFTVAYRYTQNREDAEELAQSAFVKAYRYLPSFRGDAKFSTWLYTIVNSLSLTFIKRKKQPLASLDDERITYEPASDNYADDRIEQRGKQETLKEAMSKLGADDQTVLTLFYLAEQSLEEASVIMGIDKNTFKVKLHRARQRLRILLESNFKTELKTLQHNY